MRILAPFPKGQEALLTDSELGMGDKTRSAFQMFLVAQWRVACRGAREKWGACLEV